jgi:pimeloyl-ACP methyl ester carboxylesterase
MIETGEIQLVLLPPIGSDERAYYRQRSLPYKVVAPQHIAWRDTESLPQHAKRFYTHLIASREVDTTKPVIWAGLSLGGALAQEFSALHPPLAQILMATFTSNRELSPPVRATGTIADQIPLSVYDLAGVIAPIIMKGIGYMSEDDIDMMIKGYRRQSKRSFRNAFRALSQWRGVEDPKRVPTLRIHGEHDPLIPLSRTHGVHVVLDTMHLITLAKPEEVNRSVIEYIDRLTGKTG